jgi:hypothetical protein
MPAVAMQAVVSDDEKALVVESALHSLDSCSDQQERPLKATVPLHSHGSIPVDFGLRNAMAHTTQTGQRNKVTVNPAAEAEGVSEAVGSQLTGEVLLTTYYPSHGGRPVLPHVVTEPRLLILSAHTLLSYRILTIRLYVPDCLHKDFFMHAFAHHPPHFCLISRF